MSGMWPTKIVSPPPYSNTSFDSFFGFISPDASRSVTTNSLPGVSSCAIGSAVSNARMSGLVSTTEGRIPRLSKAFASATACNLP